MSEFGGGFFLLLAGVLVSYMAIGSIWHSWHPTQEEIANRAAIAACAKRCDPNPEWVDHDGKCWCRNMFKEAKDR